MTGDFYWSQFGKEPLNTTREKCLALLISATTTQKCSVATVAENMKFNPEEASSMEIFNIKFSSPIES